MEIKTTMEIIDDQFQVKIENHTLRKIRLVQPIEKVAEYHQKKWVAVDDIHKALDIFMADLIMLERDLPVSTSKKITALCIKLSDRLSEKQEKVPK